MLTASDGCAAATPARASTSTSSGALISFFTTASLLRSGPRGHPVVELHGGLPPGCPEEDVQAAGEHRADELAHQVYRNLGPLHGATDDLLDQERADVPGRVDGRAGR